MDLAEMAQLLGYSEQARQLAGAGALPQEAGQSLSLEPAKGMFFDYDFETDRRSTYDYATTFYPLWVGLATPQAGEGRAAKAGAV